MSSEITIKKGLAIDRRFTLDEGAGTDAIHTNPVYCYAVCELQTDKDLTGVGLAFTLGEGNHIVCSAIEYLVKKIEGKEINELMSDFGSTYKQMAGS